MRNTLKMALGFTQADRKATPPYFPMNDGYRDGATQVIQLIDVQYDDADPFSPTQWAEAAFVATNAPMTVIESSVTAKAVYDGLEGSAYTDLSIGDTVAVMVDGVWVRTECEAAGWSKPQPIAGPLTTVALIEDLWIGGKA